MKLFSVLFVVALLSATGYSSWAASASYQPTISGAVAGFRLAGVEPDGDPLDQVVLRTKLSASGGHPEVNLIVSSYLENFRPDTTPVLPDLLHPSKTAINLGGFLQGKALLTDDAGNVLVIGDFLAEAFLDNTNHGVVTFYGPAPGYKVIGRLKGTFGLDKSGLLSGNLAGNLTLTKSQKAQIQSNRGATMKDLKKIIKVVTVVPHYYGTKGLKGTGKPLHTGFGKAPRSKPAAKASGHSGISTLTLVAGAGAVVCLMLAGVLYVVERRKAAPG